MKIGYPRRMGLILVINDMRVVMTDEQKPSSSPSNKRLRNLIFAVLVVAALIYGWVTL